MGTCQLLNSFGLGLETAALLFPSPMLLRRSRSPNIRQSGPVIKWTGLIVAYKTYRAEWIYLVRRLIKYWWRLWFAIGTWVSVHRTEIEWEWEWLSGSESVVKVDWPPACCSGSVVVCTISSAAERSRRQSSHRFCRPSQSLSAERRSSVCSKQAARCAACVWVCVLCSFSAVLPCWRSCRFGLRWSRRPFVQFVLTGRRL